MSEVEMRERAYALEAEVKRAHYASMSPEAVQKEINESVRRSQREQESLIRGYVKELETSKTPDEYFAERKKENEEREKQRLKVISAKGDTYTANLLAKWKREEYLKYYKEWSQDYRAQFIEDWKKRNPFSRDDMYKTLMLNVSDPWKHINACTYIEPLDPRDTSISKFDLDLYYDTTVPYCGTVYDWWNTPGVDLGGWGSRSDLYAIFERTPIMGNVDMFWTKLKNTLRGPFYVIAGTVSLVALSTLLK